MSRRSMQLVMKVSKYCNLRCSYCYEFDQLGNKERMSPALLESIFRKARAFAEASAIEHVRFTWHGGEPFMVPVEHFRQIDALQRSVFDGGMPVWNTAQTNLTILPAKLLAYLQSREFFKGVGISFDVHGDQRVDQRGQPSTKKVLANLQTLLESGVAFGAIAVLARNTLPHVRSIVEFYEQLAIPFRFLPFYLSAYDAQIDRHAITQAELVDAMRLTFDLWLASEHPIPIDPLDSYIDHAVDHIAGTSRPTYVKDTDEIVFVVDVDGSVSGMADTYDPQRTYGNLATMDMDAILASPGRRRALDECHARMETFCAACPYFGACPGHFVAEASPAQRRAMNADGCPARAIIDHIVERLTSTHLDACIIAGIRGARDAGSDVTASM